MNFYRLKKFACVVLAASITFSSLQIQPKEALATTFTEASKYANFADAVKAMYDGKTDQVTGDYELEGVSSVEYSVAKKSINTSYTANTSVSSYQVEQSFLWSEKSIGNLIEATKPSSIKYLKKVTRASLENLSTSSQASSQNNWDYDIVDLSVMNSNGSGSSWAYGKVAVNVRPTTPISGSVTLPAYITDSTYGKIECVELGDGAFLQNEELTEVNIPDTYQRICAYAFTGCTKLEKVSFVTTKETNSGIGYTIDTTVSEKQSMDNSNIHLLGTGAFAGCKSLKNALLPETLLEGYMYVYNDDIKGFAGRTNNVLSYSVGEYVSSATYHIVASINDANLKKFGDAVTHGAYYMGQGVYRDCYSLTSVELTGINPYVPSSTFAGCSKISEIKVNDSVKNITFGIASFAGADGNNAASEKSGLKKLELTSKNLENVNIGAYAFKNCHSLNTVKITATLNEQPELGTLVQSTCLTTQNAFENSFAENGSFIYEPHGDISFTVPDMFFKNCKNLKNISIMDNLAQNSDKDNTHETLIIGEKAFEGVGCKDVTLQANYLILKTGSMYGLSTTDTLTLDGGYVVIQGEPFSNTRNNFKTTLYTSLKNININATSVNFSSDTLNTVSTSLSTSASFYGVGADTVLTFSENVKNISGSVSNLVAQSVKYNTHGNVETHNLYHSGLGEISKIYIKGYATTLNSDNGTSGTLNSSVFLFQQPLTDYYDSEYSDVNKDLTATIYADGKTYDAVNNLVKRVNNNRLKASEHMATILKNSMEWIETTTEFNPENLNDGRGINVQYADGTVGYVKYSKEEQDAGATNGENGFVITNLKQVKDDIINSSIGKEITLSVMYRGKVGAIYATIIKKQATEMEVKQSDSLIIAGTSPKNTDIEFLSVTYNDGTIEKMVSDMENVTVSLENGDTYVAGENLLNITYLGCTKQIKVSAEAEKVVSLSAVQTKNTLFPGDKLTKDDFKVTAYYNSGKIVTDYTDFEIENLDILITTTSVKLTSADGVDVIVELKVSTLEPKSLSVLYNGTAVQQGADVEKKNFSVTLIYENNTTKVLDESEYMLVYDMIVGNTSNAVQVVYKLDPEIRQTVYVAGVTNSATNEPINSVTPIASSEPNNGNSSNATTTPIIDTTNTPGSSSAVTPSATPTAQGQNTTEPSSTPVVSITLDNSSVPSATVTGSSVSSVSGTSVNTTKTSLTLGVGEKVKITISGASTVTYQTSNDAILSVTNDGVVKAKKVGKADIIVTKTDGNIMICTITVKKAPKKVKVNFTKKTLKKGKKAKIKVSFVKGYYSRTRTFKSSNKKIATVNSKGVITAKKKGTCKITVKTFNGKKAIIKIKVK